MYNTTPTRLQPPTEYLACRTVFQLQTRTSGGRYHTRAQERIELSTVYLSSRRRDVLLYTTRKQRKRLPDITSVEHKAANCQQIQLTLRKSTRVINILILVYHQHSNLSGFATNGPLSESSASKQ